MQFTASRHTAHGAAVAGESSPQVAYFFKNPKVVCMTGAMMAVELSDARLARGCRAAVAFAVLHEHACYSLLIVFSSFGSEMP